MVLADPATTNLVIHHGGIGMIGLAFLLLLLVLVGTVVVGGMVALGFIGSTAMRRSRAMSLQEQMKVDELQHQRKLQLLRQDLQMDAMLGDRQLLQQNPEKEPESVKGKPVDVPMSQAERRHLEEVRSRAQEADY